MSHLRPTNVPSSAFDLGNVPIFLVWHNLYFWGNFSYFCPLTKYVGVVRGDDGDGLWEEDLFVLKNRVTLSGENRSLEIDFHMLPNCRLEKS